MRHETALPESIECGEAWCHATTDREKEMAGLKYIAFVNKWIGRPVRTVILGDRDFTKEARARRRWGEGTIVAYHDSHGLCFDVLHGDGVVASYDPDEIFGSCSAAMKG